MRFVDEAASRCRWRILPVVIAAVALLSGWTPSAATAVEACAGVPAGASADVPTLAYYYIWFEPRSWRRAKIDLPQLGTYGSAEPDVIGQHIAWAQAAGIDGFIVSWKHEPRLDEPLARLVEEAHRTGFKLVLLYQGLDFERNPLNPKRVAADLQWFEDTYGNDPAFDLFGTPTVVWSGTWKFTDEQIAQVRSDIGAPGALHLLGSERSADAYAPRAALFDGDAYYWSSGDPLTTPRYDQRLEDLAAAIDDDHGTWIAPVAPGFDARLVGGSSMVQRRDGATYRAAWCSALRTDPGAVGIISWNEFSENSHIDPSQAFGTTYLEITAELAGGAPGSLLPFPSMGPDIDPTPGVDSSGSIYTGPWDVALSAALAVALLALLATFIVRTRRRPA